MPRPTILPDPGALRLDGLAVDDEEIVLTVRADAEVARCPTCGGVSRRVHSWYTRRVADLPWQGAAARLRLRVRRFFCGDAACERRVFAERLPTVAAPYARRTVRLDDWIRRVAVALGGRPGERLLRASAPAVGRDALLAQVRSAPDQRCPTPRVLGVDDFALRRGRTYGTILVDLERHRVVDLLPDRTAATLAAWLAAHPGVEIISRDRGGAYADGARRGAPAAGQVADRFHLLANSGEVLERVLMRLHGHLRSAAMAVGRATAASAPADVPATSGMETMAEPTTRAARDRAARRARRLARYEAVLVRAADGWSQVAIAAELGVDRKTIRRYLRAGAFPERVESGARTTMLAPHDAHLRARWTAGCRNARLLWEEITARGFRGSASLVRRYVGLWRTGPARRGRAAARGVPDGSTALTAPTRVPSPRHARWLLLRPMVDLRPDERAYRAALLASSDDLRAAHELAEAFGRLVRARDQAALAPWLDQAATSGVPEFRAFAAHLRRDRAAVDAALRLTWSNGQTEGQITRLKATKRAMYGRACFDLLRLRVLHTSA